MRLLKAAAIAAPAIIATAAAAAASYRWYSAHKEERAWSAIAARAEIDPPRFDERMIDDLPPVAQSYFRHAIAPGTPLSTTVELEMRGTFLLGDDAASVQAYAMAARQVLAPTRSAFIWQPRLQRGAMVIRGSDGLWDGTAWTQFFLLGLVPVADIRSSGEDMIRSAAFRAVAEGIWAPASLLPANGARWEQTGLDKARVTMPSVGGPVTLELVVGPGGASRQVSGKRWTNANPEKVFRWQPFGALLSHDRSFGGFTIPTRVQGGNQFGTPDFLPFYQAQLTAARFL